jgi:hypothetical protein
MSLLINNVPTLIGIVKELPVEHPARLEHFQRIDERRVMVKALRDINHELQYGTTRRAQKILAHVSLSLPEIGEPLP